MNRIQRTSVIMIGMLAAGLTACGEESPSSPELPASPEAVATVVVSPGTTEVTVGDSQTYSVVVTGNRGTALTNRNVTWETGDAAIASVDAVGRVTTISPGTTSVTATVEGVTGVAVLTALALPLAMEAPDELTLDWGFSIARDMADWVTNADGATGLEYYFEPGAPLDLDENFDWETGESFFVINPLLITDTTTSVVVGVRRNSGEDFATDTITIRVVEPQSHQLLESIDGVRWRVSSVGGQPAGSCVSWTPRELPGTGVVIGSIRTQAYEMEYAVRDAFGRTRTQSRGFKRIAEPIQGLTPEIGVFYGSGDCTGTPLAPAQLQGSFWQLVENPFELSMETFEVPNHDDYTLRMAPLGDALQMRDLVLFYTEEGPADGGFVVVADVVLERVN